MQDKKLSYHFETERQQCITFYHRNDLHQRPTPTSNESADLLRTQRINFGYARCMPQQHMG